MGKIKIDMIQALGALDFTVFELDTDYNNRPREIDLNIIIPGMEEQKITGIKVPNANSKGIAYVHYVLPESLQVGYEYTIQASLYEYQYINGKEARVYLNYSQRYFLHKDGWTARTNSVSSSKFSEDIEIKPYVLHRYELVGYKGIYKISIKGSFDTIVYFTTSNNFSEDGNVGNYNEETMQFDGFITGDWGENFTLEVTMDSMSPNGYYYVWVRAGEDGATGTTHLTIEPPQNSNGWNTVNMGTYIYEELEDPQIGGEAKFNGGDVWHFVVESQYRGKLRCRFPSLGATSGAIDTQSIIVYMLEDTDQTNFDYGQEIPNDFLAYDYGSIEHVVRPGVTYHIWARPKTLDLSGEAMWVLSFPTKDISRPDLFHWDTDKIQGRPFKLTAQEWDGLTSNINKTREYMGVPQYTFTKAEDGRVFTAAMYEQTRAAIQAIPGAGTNIQEVKRGDPVTADCLNILVTSINEVE